MPYCDKCWEDKASLCQRVGDPTLLCSKKIVNITLHRAANGAYDNLLRNALPMEARNLDGLHLDGITGLGTPVAPPAVVTTAAHVLLIADLVANTATFAQGGYMIGLLMIHPDQYANAMTNVSRLLGTGPTAAQSTLMHMVLNAVETSRVRMTTATVTPLAATTTVAYKQKAYPRAYLLQAMVKNVEKGEVVQEDVHEMLDATTGKKYIPFEKATKVSSSPNLLYALYLFTTCMIQVMGEAHCVYFRLVRDVTRVCNFYGFKLAHEYIDAILRRLDEGQYTCPDDLMRHGDHNRILSDLQSLMPPLPKEKDIKITKDPRARITFGPVTVPLGGPGAGVINDFVTKKPKLCNRYHATPRQACSAGLPVGHPCAGQCAFTH